MGTEDDISGHLDTAWSQIGRSTCDLDMPDVIAHEDISQNWDTLRRQLEDGILDNRFTPSRVEIVDLPKDRLTVRPLARLEIESRLAYETAVYALAGFIDRKLPPSVYSYRMTKPGQLRNAPYSWIRMQRYARRRHKQYPDMHLARTDISSFYENIDTEILTDDIKLLGGPNWAVDFIILFLKAFNSVSSVWGLPQGTNASGVLANLYLLPLDEELKRSERIYLRYSDDIYVFGPDWINLRQTLLKSTRTLRARRLTLSGIKTKIVSGDGVMNEIEGFEKDAVTYGLDLSCPSAFNELRKIFRLSIETDPPNTRDLKFSLNQLGRFGDDYALQWILRNFTHVPHIAREALVYLEQFPQHARAAYDHLVPYLKNGALDPFPFAQQHLIIFMIRGNLEHREAIDTTWSILLDRNVEGYVREMAARYLGRCTYSASGAPLKKAFQDESDERVRRALLVACYESGQTSPNWLESILDTQENPSLRRVIQYIISNPKHIPLPKITRQEWIFR